MVALFAADICMAQASGNIGYSQSRGRTAAEQNERSKRSTAQTDIPPTQTSMFIDASVLMNVKADEYVAVFGLAHECATVPECAQKMDANVAAFKADLRSAGVRPEDVYVDFAAQNKIYDFQVVGDIAKERLAGFELKKNVSIRYRDDATLDKLMIAASKSKIYDLVKVDYIVRDVTAIQNRLADEAAKVIEQKMSRYQRLGSRLKPPAQVYAEKPSIYYPAEMYDSYTAFESEQIDSDFYRRKYTVQSARKSRTFFFNALNADGFDVVVNPVPLEPVVQFTLYLKVRYEIEQPAGR
jgi:uncharacterized protein YggE